MKKDWELTEEAFNTFLCWLHADRKEAGKIYEQIRRHLIVIFKCKGCAEAEELTDEAINRVIKQAPRLIETYVGKPIPYFVTVANHLFLEYIAKRPTQSELPPDLPQPPTPDPEEEREYECLESCMQELKQSDHDFVLQYYQENKQAKIDHRKILARQKGVKPNALRIRAFRIRQKLQKCIDACLVGAPAHEMDHH